MSAPRGVRVEVLLQSTFAEDDRERSRAYRLEVDSAKGSVLRFESNGTQELKGASGLWELETEESLEVQRARLSFASSELARLLFARLEPQDHLRIVFSDGMRRSVAFDGFISGFEDGLQMHPQGLQASLTLESLGLRKILDQAIFNWQAALSPADDQSFTADGQTLYRALQGDGRPPQEIVRAFLEAWFKPHAKLEIGEGKLEPGNWFRLAEGRDWSCAYDAKFPLAYQLLYQAWGSSLWELFTSLAEPDLHECFVTYAGEAGEERPTLVFRPRPFPGAEGDDAAWSALPVRKLGVDGAPGATAVLRSRSDRQRANAFHWAWTGFTDRSTSAFAAKAQLGWWADRKAIARYGFAAKQVVTQLLPSGGGDDPNVRGYLEGVEALLKRVAYQEAPLHQLESQSRSYPLMTGIRPGMVVEDHSGGIPTTGYLASVSHRLRWDRERIEATTHLGLVRALPGATVETYPREVRARLALERIPYLKPREIQAAQDGASAPPKAQSQGPAQAGGVPYATAIQAAAAKQGVPPAVLAAILKQESGFNRMARNPDSSAAGIAQFLKGTADDMGRRGCRNPDGTPFTAADRLDAEKSIHAAAWYLKDIAGALEAKGLPKDHPEFWGWVAYGYNRGPGAAAGNGSALGWNLPSTQGLPVTGKNDPSYWLSFGKTVSTFGSLR
ncbi:MAG: transglycosylase SLT domain-containing protein [Acidobacteria bacterium]|nr:transglycosylase SLT domain-containing protein [Acidobacteriota bacterium]